MLKFEYLGKEVFYQRGYVVILSDLCNESRKDCVKFRVISTLSILRPPVVLIN
jgi:hypothetical protein